MILKRIAPDGMPTVSSESGSALGDTLDENQPRPPASSDQSIPLRRSPWLVARSTSWFFSIGVLFGLAWTQPSLAEDDFAAELPRIEPTEPADAVGTFKVADGFQIEQVAAEPLVNSPVAIEWDADGYLYVCEMRGYSEDRDQGISRITRLEDTDDDGVFDKSIVFVDGLLWPTAIFPFADGLFVGDAPNLFYFQDTDGDGKADLKQTVLTGFGTSNVQGLMNSFRWGLDNRIHIATSSSGGMIQKNEDDEPVNVRGRDVAFNPRTFEFELVSGAAQHGMCFDDWGRKFVSSNSDHLQQVMYEDRYLARNQFVSAPPARISIAADGPQAEVFRASPVEPWRIVRTRLRVAKAVPGPIEGGGRAAGYFTGATGVTIYRGDAWPEQWRGLAIVGDVGSNLVHRKRLGSVGLEFRGNRIDENSEFVASTDIWFRPAQFANAPDGSLHVIDVYREVIEHPLSLPPQIKQHLDLTSGRDRGRVYRIVPIGFKHRKTPKLSAATTPQLVKLLEHPNAWHRETAARLLFERQDESAAPLLRTIATESPTPLGRLHALYALDGLDLLDSETLLSRLSDENPQVRRHAVRLSEASSDQSLVSKLASMASDPSLDVRYQLAFSIGEIELGDRAGILASIIRRDPDDRWVRAAVQTSLAEDAGQLFTELIADNEFRSAGAIEFLQALATQIGAQDRRSDIELALDSLTEVSEDETLFALPILGQLLRQRNRSDHVLAKLDQAGKLQRIDGQLEKMIGQSMEIATKESNATQQRVSAIEVLRFGRWQAVNDSLVSLIDSRQPQEIQQAALTALGSFNEPGVAEPILNAWHRLSPSLRETAADVIFARPERLNAMFDAIDQGRIAVSDVSQARWKLAMNIKSVKSRALNYAQATGSKARQEVVDAYQTCLTMAADAERGRAAFRKHCASCHRVEGYGHEIGPSLAAIKTRGPETILVNVLDPNREVNPQYLNYLVLTEDGRTLTGMVASENASSVTLRRAESASDTVQRGEIDQMRSSGLSIMPEGMEEAIDQQALADIIEYLMKVEG